VLSCQDGRLFKGGGGGEYVPYKFLKFIFYCTNCYICRSLYDF